MDCRSWIIDKGSNERISAFKLHISQIEELANADEINELLGGCYEGDECFYLSGDDGTITVDEHRVDFNNNNSTLFSFSVDTEWAELSIENGFSVLIMIHEDDVYINESSSFEEIQEIYHKNRIDLISIMVIMGKRNWADSLSYTNVCIIFS